MELEVGSTIGDYQVTGILGAGGMGKVYKVRNVISDRVEAMKVLLPDLAASPELADRFLREIKVLAMLDHPNIAQLHTAVRADNQLLMVMEFVDGETLDHRVRQGKLPLADVLNYMSQVLSALEFAHSRGVVHRDIKPANMMLTHSGVIKLMDFGIARAAADQKLTMTGTTVGSVYYMSPEQIQGAATLDARADLYSVGITLYELATGKRPFDGESQYAIMAAHLEKTPVPPITLDPQLPQALNEVILMSVAKDPNSRFQSAAAFRNALVAVNAEMQTATIAPPTPAPAPRAPVPQAPPQAQMPQVAAAVGTPAKGKRGLWLALGAVAATAAIVCAIEFAPRKATHAAQPLAQVASVPTPQPMPAAPVEDAKPPADVPSVTASTPPIVASDPQPAPSHANQQAIAVPPRKQPDAVHQPEPVRQPAPTQQAVVIPAPNPAPVAPPSAPPSAPPTSPAPNRAEVERLRDHLDKLQVRVGAIHDSLANLRGSMQSQGLTLNAKFTQPQGLMDTYVRSANDALNRGDVASARSNADKAEHQIEILESLLNL